MKKKFIVIDDILKFISEYNKKYKTKLNIQSEPEELELINQISDYLLNLIYGIENEDLECDENSQINIESNNSNNSIDISIEVEDDSSNEDNENILYIDEFKPKIINNRNK